MDTGALEDGNRECEAAMDKIVDAYNEFVDEEIEVAPVHHFPPRPMPRHVPYIARFQ